MKLIFAATTVLSLVASTCMAQQFEIDDRSGGTWIKQVSGHRLEFKRSGEMMVTMQGGFKNFTSPGHIQQCGDTPGSLCFTVDTFGKCGFRHAIRSDGVMNLVKTQGTNICDELSGDYTREAQ